MCQLERRCSFHGCAAPVFPCLAPTFPLWSPLVGLPGEFQDTPVVLHVSGLCAATVACVRVLFSRVRCTRSRWGLRSPSVPQMIRFLGKMPAAVSVQSFPSRGRRQRGAQ
ncbi:hypothetical protein S245_033344, partial [Arachis hypogaea]